MQAAHNPSKGRPRHRNVRGPSLDRVLLERKHERQSDPLSAAIARGEIGPWYGRGPLTVDVHIDRPGIAVITLTGDIDPTTSSVIRHAVASELQLSPVRIVVDLEHVTYLGSAGATELVAARHLARERNVDVVLVAPGRVVRRTLHLVGAVGLFAIYANVRDAVCE